MREPSRRRTLLATVVSGFPLLASVSGQTPPGLPDLLRLAADYHASYAATVSGVSWRFTLDIILKVSA